MPDVSFVEGDKRVLKEDYCNFDLIARCWNDQYLGRVWRNKERVAEYEGTDLDEIMLNLRAIVDELQHEKREKRGKRKPTVKETADAVISIEPKLSRSQKMILVIHLKALNQRLTVKAISRVGDYATPFGAFLDYAEIAKRLSDELAYAPGNRKKDLYPGTALMFNEEIVVGSVTADTALTLRPEVAKALELLNW